jgi:hypothetical protein
MNFDGIAFGFGGGGGGGGGGGTVTSISTDSTLIGGPIEVSGTLGIALPVITSIANSSARTQHITASIAGTMLSKNTVMKIGLNESVIVTNSENTDLLRIEQDQLTVNEIMATQILVPSTPDTYDVGMPSQRYRSLHVSGGVFCDNLFSSLPAGHDFISVANQTFSTRDQIDVINGDITVLNQKTSTLSVDNFTFVNDDFRVNGLQVIAPTVTNANTIGLLVQSNAVGGVGAYITTNCTNNIDAPNASIQTAGGVKIQKDLRVFGDIITNNVMTDQGNLNALSVLTGNLSGRIAALDQKTSTLSVGPNSTTIDDNLVAIGEIVIQSRSAIKNPAFLIDSISGTVPGYMYTTCTADTDTLHPSITTLGGVRIFKDLEVPTINGWPSNGGVYSGTADGELIFATGTMFPPGVGSLELGGGRLRAGDSFHLICAGDIPSARGQDQLLINLSLAGTLMSALYMDMENVTDVFFSLEIDFTVRAVNGNIAEIVTNIYFTFNRAPTDQFKGRRICFTSAANTVAASTLVLNAEWNTGSASSIQTKLCRLTKVY